MNVGRGDGGFDSDRCHEGHGWIRVQKKPDFRRAVKWENLVTVFVAICWRILLPVGSKVFSPAIVRMWMLFIPKSNRRGFGHCFGFVRFKDRRLALKSIAAVNGSSLMGRKLPVTLASFSWSQRRISSRGRTEYQLASSSKDMGGKLSPHSGSAVEGAKERKLDIESGD